MTNYLNRFSSIVTQALAFTSLLFATLAPTIAQAQSVAIIRDAEIESLIASFAAPLLKAAGLNETARIHLVADRRFNAFVVEGGDLYINHGTILDVQTPSALKAVLAHEIGHLAGGHLAAIRERMEVNGRLQIAAMLLGVGAVAASAGSANNEVGEMATAFMLAAQSAGQNSILAYRRSEESAADGAGLALLEKTGQSGKGMVDVLTRLADNHVASAGAAPYLSSHPQPKDRLAHVTQVAKANRNWQKSDSRADKAALALAQAKLMGFLESQQTVLNTYPNSDKSAAARYARIITAYKGGAAIAALTQMPKLAMQNPTNPYFQELLGQMYFETGQGKKAVAPLQNALKRAPKQTQIRILYGQVLIDIGDFDEAAAQLNRSTQEEPNNARVYTLLSRAYAGLKRTGEAKLAAAQAALARNEKSTALGLARQAQKELIASTPAWIRAEDIILSLH